MKRSVLVVLISCLFVLALTGSAMAAATPGTFSKGATLGVTSNGDGSLTVSWPAASKAVRNQITIWDYSKSPYLMAFNNDWDASTIDHTGRKYTLTLSAADLSSLSKGDAYDVTLTAYCADTMGAMLYKGSLTF